LEPLFFTMLFPFFWLASGVPPSIIGLHENRFLSFSPFGKLVGPGSRPFPCISAILLLVNLVTSWLFLVQIVHPAFEGVRIRFFFRGRNLGEAVLIYVFSLCLHQVVSFAATPVFWQVPSLWTKLLPPFPLRSFWIDDDSIQEDGSLA